MQPVRIDQDLARHEAALQFLLGRIDYERAVNVAYGAREFKLERMRHLLRRLGDPQQGMPIIHIAGTKGKGSTAGMIGGILTAAGYRTGLFTSPHLDRLEERMAVDGAPCPPDELVSLVDHLRPVVEAMDQAAAEDELGAVTYFELTTALALLHFRQRGAHAAVLEVGMGGRLDSTNVCQPCVAVITNISFDHMQQLGNTLAAIAREKAGIIKRGVPVVSGVIEPEARDVIRESAQSRGCRLVELGVDFDFRYHPPSGRQAGPPSCGDWQPSTARVEFFVPAPATDERAGGIEYPLALIGRHQAANAAIALATVGQLRQAGWQIGEEAVGAGLAGTACPARVEVVAQRPKVVLDVAHNVASIRALMEVLDESFPADRRLLIFATTQGKDLRGMLAEMVGKFDEMVFTRYLNNPRSVPPEELQSLAAELTGRRFPAYADPADAWEQVREMVAPDDLVCITGSFFIAAEMRRLLAARPLLLPAEAEARESA